MVKYFLFLTQKHKFRGTRKDLNAVITDRSNFLEEKKCVLLTQ